jgi:hypothetical protein
MTFGLAFGCHIRATAGDGWGWQTAAVLTPPNSGSHWLMREFLQSDIFGTRGRWPSRSSGVLGSWGAVPCKLAIHNAGVYG